MELGVLLERFQTCVLPSKDPDASVTPQLILQRGVHSSNPLKCCGGVDVIHVRQRVVHRPAAVLELTRARCVDPKRTT